MRVKDLMCQATCKHASIAPIRTAWRCIFTSLLRLSRAVGYILAGLGEDQLSHRRSYSTIQLLQQAPGTQDDQDAFNLKDIACVLTSIGIQCPGHDEIVSLDVVVVSIMTPRNAESAIVALCGEHVESVVQAVQPQAGTNNLVALTLASCETTDRETLIPTVVALTQRSHDLRQQRDLCRRSMARQAVQLQPCQQQLCAAEAQAEAHQYLKRRRTNKSQLVRRACMTVSGMYRLAIKRNFGYAGAASTVSTLVVGVSTSQVYVCENIFRANMWGRAHG